MHLPSICSTTSLAVLMASLLVIAFVFCSTALEGPSNRQSGVGVGRVARIKDWPSDNTLLLAPVSNS